MIILNNKFIGWLIDYNKWFTVIMTDWLIDWLIKQSFHLHLSTGSWLPPVVNLLPRLKDYLH